jgi:hypothetical protein
MNEFPDKENIINLTLEELNDIYTLIDNTKIIELRNLCKKYGLKCSTIKVKELKIFLKEFIKKEHQGKFENTTEGLKEKKLPELKKIMKENGIEIKVGEKKDDFIKKILAHYKKTRKSSSSSKKSSSKKSSSKTKSPSSKKRNSVQHKFKKNDRIYIEEIGRGYIKNYDPETNTYTIKADDAEDDISDITEDQIKHISSKSKTPEVQIKPEHIYSAETIYEPELKPGYSAETIPDYDEPVYERDSDKMPELVPDSNEIPDEYIEENQFDTEIIEEDKNNRINIEDIPEFLNVFQDRTVENILDDEDVRITELIQKCLLMGIA